MKLGIDVLLVKRTKHTSKTMIMRQALYCSTEVILINLVNLRIRMLLPLLIPHT